MDDTVSLNAGLASTTTDIQPEDIFDTTEPGVAPQLREDVDIIGVIETQLQDLDYLRNDITQTNGMSQAFALEAQRLIPGFGQDTPLKFYTDFPSATRLKPALEEISRTTWGLIAAAAAAVIASIWKIIRWIRGDKGGGKGGGGGGGDDDIAGASKDAGKAIEKKQENLATAKEETKDAAQEVTEAVREIEGNSEYTYTDANGKEKPLRNMEDAIEDMFVGSDKYDRVKMFLESEDPLFHDIVTNGPYVSAIKDMAPLMRALNGLLTARLANIKSVMKRDMGNGSQVDEAINRSELGKLNQPISLRFNNGERTMSEIATSLSDLRNDVRDKKTHKRVSFDHLFQIVSDAYDKSQLDRTLQDIKLSTTILADMEKELDNMRKVAASFSSDGNAGNLTAGIGNEVRAAIFQNGRDLAAFGLLIAEVKIYTNYMEHLANTVSGVGGEVARKVVASTRGKDGKAPPAWVRLAKGLGDRMKRLTDAYYSHG